MLTRIDTGDYDTWKVAFDQDAPGVRSTAKSYRILRSVENPGEVTILVEFNSEDDARAGREKLLGSGILDRFSDKDLPKLVEEAESHTY
ncbi:MAG TPA: hypothetical protein VIL92_06925 [Gaiellaceae bacterium]